MTLSIIIPFYYGNKYLDRLLKALDDNYKKIQHMYTIEVIIINDSPKENVKITNSNHLFKIYIHENKQNLGIHKSRIMGLKLCTGKYVLFLDQDDIIANNYIISQLEKIKNQDFIVCNGFYEYKYKKQVSLYSSQHQQNLCLDKRCHYYLKNPIISPGQVVIKKEIIPKKWINSKFFYNGADDHYLWLLLLEQDSLGVINYDKIYTHKYTGHNTSLDEELMTKSNMELLKQIKGISSKINFYVFKRRLLYWKNRHNLKAILYLDGAIIKRIYRKLIWNR